MMAYGDVFEGLGTDQDRTLSTAFQKETSDRARAGTPFAQGALPTSVYASSPGFNPDVAKLLASINAQATGQPADDYLRRSQLYQPTATRESGVGRTA